eukprot:GHUV01003607.1.p1 GENE.GHUV01003607.1~~GHUV01003607.1.p1  ORF type:complete len:210 (+),score=59.55 GHUV01003607.1:313-942(+)
MLTQKRALASQQAGRSSSFATSQLRPRQAAPQGSVGRRQLSSTVASYSKDAVNGVTKRGSGPAVRTAGRYPVNGTQQGSLRAAIKQQKVPPPELAIINIFNLLATPLSYVVDTPWYRALEAVLLTVQLAVVDAAYSGDWVRVGAITPEVESLLQKVVWVIVSLHLVCGVSAAVLAEQRGKSAVKAGLKGLLFGTLAIYEVTSPKTQGRA